MVTLPSAAEIHCCRRDSKRNVSARAASPPCSLWCAAAPHTVGIRAAIGRRKSVLPPRQQAKCVGTRGIAAVLAVVCGRAAGASGHTASSSRKSVLPPRQQAKSVDTRGIAAMLAVVCGRAAPVGILGCHRQPKFSAAAAAANAKTSARAASPPCSLWCAAAPQVPVVTLPAATENQCCRRGSKRKSICTRGIAAVLAVVCGRSAPVGRQAVGIRAAIGSRNSVLPLR